MQVAPTVMESPTAATTVFEWSTVAEVHCNDASCSSACASYLVNTEKLSVSNSEIVLFGRGRENGREGGR